MISGYLVESPPYGGIRASKSQSFSYMQHNIWLNLSYLVSECPEHYRLANRAPLLTQLCSAVHIKRIYENRTQKQRPRWFPDIHLHYILYASRLPISHAPNVPSQPGTENGAA